MKLSIFKIVLPAFFIAICACTQPRPEPAGPMPHETDSITVDSVLKPLSTARADIATFDTVSTHIIKLADSLSGHPPGDNETVSIKAFTIRAVDLFTAMGMKITDDNKPQYDHIRVYMGYNMEANKFKLYIVPVNNASIQMGEAGTDLVLNADGTPHPDPHNGTDSLYVLDLNAPCPNLCDANSPLLAQ